MSKVGKKEIREFPAFHDYLKERGLEERVSIAAEKMIIARQLAREMEERNLSKASMAKLMGTSRAQLDRVLNPSEQNVTIETLARAARVLGRRLRVELL
jgi:hypothetical protein